jgi:Spy/CpxP family protein refolding chaperone
MINGFRALGGVLIEPNQSMTAPMKKFALITILTGMFVAASPILFAQTPADASAKAAATELDKGSEKRTKAALDALNLTDPAKTAKVHDIIYDYLMALKSWHATNDATIKPLWPQFNAARNTHDPAKIQTAINNLEAAYASFKPVHDDFNAKLAMVLAPEQVETVKDAFTVKKVEVTYRNYQVIIPGLTDAENAEILKDLKGAREEAIDAEAMTEKSAFFKKWKDKIEAYLTAQGIDVKKDYKDFGEKEKADAAAKKAGTPAATPAADKPADAKGN